MTYLTNCSVSNEDGDRSRFSPFNSWDTQQSIEKTRESYIIQGPLITDGRNSNEM